MREVRLSTDDDEVGGEESGGAHGGRKGAREGAHKRVLCCFEAGAGASVRYGWRLSSSVPGDVAYGATVPCPLVNGLHPSLLTAFSSSSTNASTLLT